MVKSARHNFAKRDSIRKTWGSSDNLQNHYISLELPTKLVFICGIPSEIETEQEKRFSEESKTYQDIVVADFVDTYFNNTYKSVLSFKWALEELGSDFKYLGLFDDDIYVNMPNIVCFLRSISYTKVLRVNASMNEASYLREFKPTSDVESNSSSVYDLLSMPLYAGNIAYDTKPFRESGKFA
jgi:hypothetical protein